MRRESQQILNAIPSSLQERQSTVTSHKVIAYIEKERSETKVLLSFCSMPGEIDTLSIMKWAHINGIRIALPRIDDYSSAMQFHYIQFTNYPQTLERHKYGFYQPSANPMTLFHPTTKREDTVMLVPGIAFDITCHRLGRGRGYYDTYLDQYHTNLTAIGICFYQQLVAAVPCEPHDRLVDIVISG